MTPEEHNAVLEEARDILRRELQIDENGDSFDGVEPQPGWERGYCAGIRTAYRTLKNADPQVVAVPASQVSQTAYGRAAPVGPAESASPCVIAAAFSAVPVEEMPRRCWKVQFSENGEEYYGHLTIEAYSLECDPVNNNAFFVDGVWIEIDEHIVSVEELQSRPRK